MMSVPGKIYSKKWMAVLLCLFLIICDFVIVDASGESVPEQPVRESVKAGVFYFDGYHIEDDEGRLTGYGTDLLQLISRYSHLNM